MSGAVGCAAHPVTIDAAAATSENTSRSASTDRASR